MSAPPRGMRITNASGATLGYVDADPLVSDIGRRVAAAASAARRTAAPPVPPADPRPSDPAPAERGAQRVTVSVRNVAIGAGAILAGLALLGAVSPDPAPPVPAASSAPVAERVAPGSGAPRGLDPADIEVGASGRITAAGLPAGNVLDDGNPLAARYLEELDGIPHPDTARVLLEGGQFCEDLANGRVVALREAVDARSGAEQFGTGTRRATIARAALRHFCPRFGS